MLDTCSCFVLDTPACAHAARVPFTCGRRSFRHHPRNGILIGLACQFFLLPLVGYATVVAFDLDEVQCASMKTSVHRRHTRSAHAGWSRNSRNGVTWCPRCRQLVFAHRVCGSTPACHCACASPGVLACASTIMCGHHAGGGAVHASHMRVALRTRLLPPCGRALCLLRCWLAAAAVAVDRNHRCTA